MRAERGGSGRGAEKQESGGRRGKEATGKKREPQHKRGIVEEHRPGQGRPKPQRGGETGGGGRRRKAERGRGPCRTEQANKNGRGGGSAGTGRERGHRKTAKSEKKRREEDRQEPPQRTKRRKHGPREDNQAATSQAARKGDEEQKQQEREAEGQRGSKKEGTKAGFQNQRPGQGQKTGGATNDRQRERDPRTREG